MSTPGTPAFQPTRWSLVARTQQHDDPAARGALNELCQLYWPPLCAFARQWGLSAADAEDATQSFFAELLRNEKFAMADPERGKLRTFLLSTFTKRLINLRQRDRERGHLSLDAPPDVSGPAHDPADPQLPEQEFNRQWAITRMETALTRLAAEYATAGQAAHFAAFRPLLDLAASAREDYRALAQQFGMKEGATRVAAHRVRQRFREMLFATIAETLDQPTEATVRAEIGLLMASLG